MVVCKCNCSLNAHNDLMRLAVYYWPWTVSGGPSILGTWRPAARHLSEETPPDRSAALRGRHLDGQKAEHPETETAVDIEHS